MASVCSKFQGACHETANETQNYSSTFRRRSQLIAKKCSFPHLEAGSPNSCLIRGIKFQFARVE